MKILQPAECMFALYEGFFFILAQTKTELYPLIISHSIPSSSPPTPESPLLLPPPPPCLRESLGFAAPVLHPLGPAY